MLLEGLFIFMALAAILYFSVTRTIISPVKALAVRSKK